MKLPLRHDKRYAQPAQQGHRPPYTARGNLDGLLEQSDHGKQPLRHEMEDDDLVDELQVWKAHVVAHNDVPACQNIDHLARNATGKTMVC